MRGGETGSSSSVLAYPFSKLSDDLVASSRSARCLGISSFLLSALERNMWGLGTWPWNEGGVSNILECSPTTKAI